MAYKSSNNYSGRSLFPFVFILLLFGGAGVGYYFFKQEYPSRKIKKKEASKRKLTQANKENHNSTKNSPKKRKMIKG